MSNFVDGSYGSAQSTALIAKVLAGRCEMKYTRATVGKGRIPDDKTPATMTGSAEYVMDAKISGVSNPVKGECQVTVQLKSDDVQEDFRATNVVLFAEDPDVGEIPYAYLCLENESEWIGAASSSVGKLITFEIIVFVGGVDNVSISVNPESIATVAEVEKLIKDHNLDVSAHDEKFKKHITLTTDQEFINSLITNAGKVGQDCLFGSKGDKNGIISESSGFTLYKSLNNCVHYSGYQIDVVNLRGENEGLLDAHFKEPAYYLATFVEAKKVAIRILTTPIEVINDLIDSSTERALSAAQGKWLNENKLGKTEKAADSDKLDGHDSTYFATVADVQTAQRAANQGVNAAAAAHGRANEAYTRAEQAFQSASNGKTTIANAITGKGVPTSTTASWQEMAGNIGKIKGIKMGSIMAHADDNQHTGTIVTLPIDPSFIIFWMPPSGKPIATRKISPGYYVSSLYLSQVKDTNVYLNDCVDVKYYSGTSFKLRPFDNLGGIATTKSGQVNWIAIE